MAKKQKSDTATKLAEKLKERQASGQKTKTELKTDERVLARVTDGIYRQPASALRELISNAYDADASYVRITTDAPRFDSITVSDDGAGLTLGALANLVHHIGGSSKRTNEGASFGVTKEGDPLHSPGGRKLIGKIGIGLFAVAQLTRHFQIITKRKGEKFRHIADVTLKIYSESLDIGERTSGEVVIWSEAAKDKNSHGTDIVLMGLKEYTREILQSKERWIRPEGRTDEKTKWKPPAFHIGVSEYSADMKMEKRVESPAVPWSPNDSSETKFEKLHTAVLEQVGTSRSDPALNELFDNYFQTIWNLALSSPIDYVHRDPFSMRPSDGVQFYKLSNVPRGQAADLKFRSDNSSVGTAAKLASVGDTGFDVFIDDIRLKRPVSYQNLPQSTTAAWTTPLMFVGQCRQDLSDLPEDVTGGRTIAFQAYLFWAPKIVPKENNGVMVRINGASGTLFDDRFMRYEVSEQTRLRQITAEIFVEEGVDAALNIDRESFNFSHPHYQFMARWLHGALRQLSNKHKEVLKQAQAKRLNKQGKKQLTVLQKIVDSSIEELGEYAPDVPAEISLKANASEKELAAARKRGVLAYEQARVLPEEYLGSPKTPRKTHEKQLLSNRAEAVAQVLEAYGVMESLTYEEQQDLLRAVCRIFTSRAE